MSIVRMKRLRLVANSSERERLMKILALYGAVEISETEVEKDLEVSTVSTESEKLRESLRKIVSAKEIAKKYSDFKKGMFAKRPEISEDGIFSSELVLSSLSVAERILAVEDEKNSLFDKKAKTEAMAKNIGPWKKLDVALDSPCGRKFETMLITVPVAAGLDKIEESLKSESEFSELFEISSDDNFRYMVLIAHSDECERAFSALKRLGAASVRFRGTDVTANEKLAELAGEISKITERLKELSEESKVSETEYDLLLTAEDALNTRLACETESEKGLSTAHAFYIEGWFPKREEKNLADILESNGCAYEFSDPGEGETPPTLTYNSRLISPFSVITNMYSAPAYTGIDPNPMMAPFFAMFFGIMLSDAGYGLLLILAGIFALWKMKPKGGFRQFMQLAIICGTSTVIWGLLFGGIFGNSIQSIYQLFTGEVFPYDLALWFDPSQDPMKMLLFSMALGGVQIVVSMGIKGYMMIRDGAVWDAIFDIGSWWIVFAGVVVFLFNADVGLYILIAGAAALILTQGRAKKNIIMKFLGGVLSLYDVTSYFSDILSYSRLLALSLATAVVSQVINTMGVLTGPIGFFFVFIIGHVFNIAINLIGSFVHAARLQYVEFFGRFYESGGRVFAPLSIKTKNIDIIKEEN